MLVEAIPRLVVRLRSSFPEARVAIQHNDDTPTLSVSFPNHPTWKVETKGRFLEDPISKGEFQFFESTLLLSYDCLQAIPEEDYLRFIASENLGLRGVTLIPEREGTRRLIRVRAGFVGQKGRTRDEGENLLIDILSLIRFARLVEDRIVRSTAGCDFCFEMYHSQYISGNRGRNRYINYARSIFQGSTERAFGQIATMLRDDFRYDVEITGPGVAKVVPPHLDLEIVLRVPEEIPMITCYAPLLTIEGSRTKALELSASLNAHQIENGHFELSADGSSLSFVSWKHLTNDLRLYSLDHMITAVGRASDALESALGEISQSLGGNQGLIIDGRRVA